MVKKSLTILGIIFVLLVTGSFGSRPTPAAAAQVIPPIVTTIEPSSAVNDLDTTVTITGSGFATADNGSGVEVPPAVFLGTIPLPNVAWVDSTTLNATVPWGIDPGQYSITVTNPDGGTGYFSGIFEVKSGIGQWNSGNLFGGEGRQMLMKPGDPNTLYVLAYNVGLFRTRDAGENWQFISPNANGNTSYSVDPLHPGWLYANGNHAVYRSVDDGDTWTKWLPTWPNGATFNWVRVYPSAHDPQVIFLCACSHYNLNYTDVPGLFKSSDGGATWHSIDSLAGLDLGDIAFHPTDPLKMIAGTQTGRVFQSIDGGETWSEVAKPPLTNIITVAYNPFRSGEVWASQFNGPGLYKTTETNFAGWQKVNPNNNPGSSFWSLRFTGADSVYSVYSHTIDGGLTWQAYGPWGGMDDSIINPDNPQIGYAGDIYRGVQKTTDGGATWQVKNQGFTGMRALEVETSLIDPRRVYASFGTDGIFRSDDGANTWTFLPIPFVLNVNQVRENPFNPQQIFVAAGTGFYTSDNSGATWSGGLWNVPSGSFEGSPNILATDPFQPGHLLTGGRYGGYNIGSLDDLGRLYSSTDYGNTWTRIDVNPGGDFSTVRDIVFHPDTPGLVYLSTDGTGLYRSTNFGSTWQRIDDPNQYWMQWLGNITFATHPQSVLLVAVGNMPYYSLDGGDTWHQGGNAAYNAIGYLFVDLDSTKLYATAWNGLFFSSNLTATWTRATGAIAYLHSMAMDYGTGSNYSVLYVSTTGGDPNGQDYSGSVGLDQMKQDPFGFKLYLPILASGLPIPLNTMMNGGIYRFVNH
jgi:photosystem II stability/assembly factor-like uncharacterized protein